MPLIHTRPYNIPAVAPKFRQLYKLSLLAGSYQKIRGCILSWRPEILKDSVPIIWHPLSIVIIQVGTYL